MFGKKLIMVIVCLHIIVCSASAKKSVFIISSHVASYAQAYSIEGSQVVYQADIDISSQNPGCGAVGNAVWPEKNLMFITYESSGIIVWSSTKTLEKVGDFETGKGTLSGIVVDRIKNLIYVMRRGSSGLYVYSFDETENTLVLEGTWYLNPTPGYDIYGMGLALDETKNLLYVTSDGYNRVHVYDTNDFIGDSGEVAPNGFIDIVVGGNPREAIGITVDPARRYMYTGAWYGHNYLVQTQIDPPYTSDEVPVENGSFSGTVTGLGVDDETGLVYCTTTLNDFRVYDSNRILKDTEANNISGPAGVAVGGWYKTSSFSLVKDNNDLSNGCVDPNVHKNLTFDIYWDTNDHPDTSMVVIDYLPYELDYNDSSTPPGDYNSVDGTVKWNIIGNSGHIVLRTNVNKWARPVSVITNTVTMEGDTYLTKADCNVDVCPWGTQIIIIYVDKDANGFKNGTNWNDAYNELRDALTQARSRPADLTAIWVAAGTYMPVNDVNIPGYQSKSFKLPDNVALFGHFGGIETSPDQRNFANAANETILEGQIGQGTGDAVQNVIKAQNINEGLIDGFTIKGSWSGDETGAGIYLVGDANVSIVNCKIKDNYPHGIYAKNYSYPDVHNCTFSNNSSTGTFFNLCRPEISDCIFDGNDLTGYGIYMISSFISVVDSTFKRHTGYGIFGTGGTLTLTDSSFDGGISGLYLFIDVTTTMNGCIIERSGGSGMQLEYGCNLTLQNSIIRYCANNGIDLSENLATTIKNNWIHNNGAAGISFTDQSSSYVPLVRNNTIYGNHTYGIWSSEYGEEPNIINCILWGNGDDLCRGENGSFSDVNYCLLQHPRTTGTGNITGDPCFMNTSNPDDLHIDFNSICKNAGTPNNNYTGETDIDGESRVCYGRVDIGGDEYYWSKADYNKDKIVDFNDFAALANKWKMQDAGISLDTDSDVDIYDLDLFCNDWLWEAGWTQGQWMMAMAGDGGADMSAAAMESTSLLEADVAQYQTSDALMLPDVKASLLAQPARLRARSQKFYDITPIASAPVTLDSMSMSVDSETPGLTAVEEATVAEATTEAQAMTAEGLSNIFLSVDGDDLTDIIVFTDYPGQFVVAVESNMPLGPNDISVQVVNGTLEPVGDGNNSYYFQFEASGEATINLVTNVDMIIDGNSIPANTLIYQLWMYYNADLNIYAVFGIGLSDLILPPDDGE